MTARTRTGISFALLAAAATLTYSNHFDNGFHFDDSHAVVDNVHIRSLRNIPRFFTDGTTFSSLPANQTYRPVVSTTLAVDYWLGGGLKPFWFHIGTFALFLVQGWLMYLLFVKVLGATSDEKLTPWAAFLAVAWYLLHPVNAETINYVSARSDSLSTFCVVLALVLFAYSVRGRRHFLYLIPAVVGILAKAQAAVFAPLLLLYVLCVGLPRNGVTNVPARPIPMLIAALKVTLPAWAACIAALVFVGRMNPPAWTAGGASMYRYAITQPYVILRYVRTFFLPVDLSADADWSAFESLADLRAEVGLLFLAGLLAAALFTFRRPRLRPIAFGLFWFLIALVPTSFVVPLAEVMNDHRAFFPYVGFSLSASWGLFLAAAHWRERMGLRAAAARAWAGVAVVAMLWAYGWGTRQRNEVWHSEESLWHDVTLKSPANGRGWMNYGLTRMAKGDYAAAEANFTRALRYTPRYATLHVNLGVLKAATARPTEAESAFKAALAFQPRYPAAHFYYARFLEQQGRAAEAVPHLQETLRLSPAHLDARRLLMRLWGARKDYALLARLAEETLALAPNDPDATAHLSAARQALDPIQAARAEALAAPTPEKHLRVSLLLYEAGQFGECIAAAEAALRLKPDYDLAYNNICAASNRMGLWDRAIEAGERAVKLNPDNQLARNNLAWAEARKRRGAKAGRAADL